MAIFLKSKAPLQGWEYPIYADIYDKPVVEALVKAGVSKALIRDSANAVRIQPFDFLASAEAPAESPWLAEDRVAIKIVVKITRERNGIGMNPIDVLNIPFKRKI